MPGFEHEKSSSRELQAWAKSHGALCTYNGRTFDVPLIETRFMFHRRAVPARRRAASRHAAPGAAGMWRQRPLAMGTPDPDDSSCSLACSRSRSRDCIAWATCPATRIPSRFFKIRAHRRCAPRSKPVMEHNRLDLISLAAVLARAIVLITRGPSAATTAQEAYGLARVYERGGALRERRGVAAEDDRVREARRRRTEVHAEALRRLAWIRRRDRRRTKPPKRGTSWRCCRDARRRCGARPRKRSRSITSIASRICRRRASTRSICSRGRRQSARVQHRLDRLERKLARYRQRDASAQLTDRIRRDG
jgi:hypothetical protein